MIRYYDDYPSAVRDEVIERKSHSKSIKKSVSAQAVLVYTILTVWFGFVTWLAFQYA